MSRPSERPDLLGVLGGMTPLSTADFLRQITLVTPARDNSDHVPTVLLSIPQVPDRTAAILGEGPSPLPALAAQVAHLVEVGARAIVIPCNTAHHWYPELANHCPVPILHIVDAVARELGVAGEQPVGLLGTTGTRASGFYPGRLADFGWSCVEPDDALQSQVVQPAIERVKAGELDAGRELLRRAVRALRERGASRVVLACTELSLPVPGDGELEELTVDSTGALAKAAWLWARTVRLIEEQ